MSCDHRCSRGFHGATLRGKVRRASVLTSGATTLILTGTALAAAAAHQAPVAASLVFDGVTVVDVEDGELVRDQRVVVTGNRIQVVGSAGAVSIPMDAQVVDARGKYLIPGFWDMHTHMGQVVPPAEQSAVMRDLYTLLLANGVTGFRDVGTSVPLDSLVAWRRQTLAGQLVGPPRQLLGGPHLNEGHGQKKKAYFRSTEIAVESLADVRHAVDSLHAAGADHIKLHFIGKPLMDSAVALLRGSGLLFGGHVKTGHIGARFLDHVLPALPRGMCGGDSATVARCASVAETIRRHDMWPVNANASPFGGNRIGLNQAWRHLSPAQQQHTGMRSPPSDTSGPREPRRSLSTYAIMERAGVPLLIGTDFVQRLWEWYMGFVLHDEIARLVRDEGMTPLAALQAVTLNPAKALHATDSLGTVAVGKLADLILLDADPLTDIRHTLAIRAVVANGRYFDRAALDALLVGVDYDQLVTGPCVPCYPGD